MSRERLAIADRLADLRDAIRAHGLAGDSLGPEDALAIANALQGEVRRLRQATRRTQARHERTAPPLDPEMRA